MLQKYNEVSLRCRYVAQKAATVILESVTSLVVGCVGMKTREATFLTLSVKKLIPRHCSFPLQASNPLLAATVSLGSVAALVLILDRHGRAVAAFYSIYDRLATSLVIQPYLRDATLWQDALKTTHAWTRSRCASPTESAAGSESCESSPSISGRDVSSFRIPDNAFRHRRRPVKAFVSGATQSRSRPTASRHGYRASHNTDSSHLSTPSYLNKSGTLAISFGGPRTKLNRRDSSEPPCSREDMATTLAQVRARGMESTQEASNASTQLRMSCDLDPLDTPSPLLSPTAWASASVEFLTTQVDGLIRPLITSPRSVVNNISFPSPKSWLGALSISSTATASDSLLGQNPENQRADQFDEEEDEATSAIVPPSFQDSLQPHNSRHSGTFGGDFFGGSSARHYTHGGITTAPGDSSRRAALESYACAARLEARSAGSPIGHGPSPGHLTVEGTVKAGSSALASVGLDGDCPQPIRDEITDEHLLQFGALLEEDSSGGALDALGIPTACGGPSTLYGLPDDPVGSNAWEPLNNIDAKLLPRGLELRGYRLPLRGGIYMYRSHVVIEGVAPHEVRPFHLDDQARRLWDDGALSVRRVAPQGCSRASRHAESCMLAYLSRFPMPLAPRLYEYARRVWHRPADGGCYAICRSCELPAVDVDAGISAQKISSSRKEEARAVRVAEFISCVVIRAVRGGTEVATVYFEDSKVRPGLAKMAVPKGLLPFWKKYASALRVFVEARRGNMSSPGLRRNRMDGVDGHEEDGGGINKLGNGGFARDLNPSDGDDEVTEAGSDDELYSALAEYKACRRASKGLRAQSRWVRRLVIAGAIKALHAIMAAE